MFFQDLQHGAIFTAGNTFATPVSSTAGLTTVDMVDEVANRISALLTSTAVTAVGNVTVKIQESSDDSNWSDITGATFTATSAVQDLQLISFNLTKRYVRGYATLNSGTSVTLALVFLAQRRMQPANSGGWVNDTYS